MKRTFAAAAISLAMAASASAATKTPTVWQGDLFITMLSGTCSGVSVGYLAQAIYAPAGLPGNASVDQLALFPPVNAADGSGGPQQLQPAVGTTISGATSFNGWWIGNQAQAVQITNGETPLRFTVAPSTISATSTPVVILSGTRTVPSCTLTFQGALALRPGTLPN